MKESWGGVRVSDYEDLIKGTGDEKLFKGYVACLMPIVTQVLRGISKDERVEFIFEQQREYAKSVDFVMNVASIKDAAWKVTSDGKPKLAKWGFVPKGSTLMTDPADYLAYALRHHYTDHKSQRAKWTNPILTCGSSEGYGVIYNRVQIRRIVSRAQNMYILQKYGMAGLTMLRS